MANSYTWKINHLDTALSENGLEKVVKSCRWSLDATDGGDTPVTVSTYGYVNFASPADASAFVAYDSLTEQQVLDWVWASDSFDKALIEKSMDDQIDAIKNPPVKILRNPWAPPEAPKNPF